MSKPALCLVHPTGASSDALAALARELTARFRVCLPDRPGWGKEPALRRASGRSYYEQQARWLLGRLEQHAPPVALFGWSSGGFVALHAALLAPRRFDALWLFEPPLWTSREHDDRARLREFARTLGWSALRRHGRARAAFWLPDLDHLGPLRAAPRVAAAIA